MDWRLVGALSSLGGSLCLVGFGAYAVMTTNSAQPRRIAPLAALVSERSRANVSLVNVEGSAAVSSPFAASASGRPPLPALVPAVADVPSPFANTVAPAPPVGDSEVDGRSDTGRTSAGSAKSNAVVAPLHQRHVRRDDVVVSSLTPADGGRHSDQPRPVVEVKKSFVPEIHAAVPMARYSGVLTSAEIARIKHSLRLTPDQEPSWPPVAAALAEMGRQQIAQIRQGQEPRISPEVWPPQRLFSIAGPFIQVLRPEQKEQVRRLCRSMGFESVASLM